MQPYPWNAAAERIEERILFFPARSEGSSVGWEEFAGNCRSASNALFGSLKVEPGEKLSQWQAEAW